MGIRFYCPNCDHRLNVKSFLAGKRGVCPRCGGGVDIPLESVIEKGAERKNRVAEAANVANHAQMASTQPTPADPTPCPSSPEASPRASDQDDQDDQDLHGTPPESAGRPSVGARSHPRETAGAGGRIVVPTVPTAAPAVATKPVRPVRPDSQSDLPSATPIAPAIRDPIDEKPESVWYVRPPSGGQYGPARGDVMRKWIGEGRVSADSMVWREGWDDWRSGGEVFPYLRPVGTPIAMTPAPVTYAPSTPGPATRSRAYPHRRKSSLALAITTVVVLGLLSVALLITLILVLNHS